VSRPLDRQCNLPELGAVDRNAGEFWVANPFLIPKLGQNLSAYERSRMFLNVHGKAFIDASFLSAADIDSDSRSVVVADFAGDGWPDILVGTVGGGPLRLFRNQFPRTNRRLRLDLMGVASNRPGIGARIIASVGGQQIVRDRFPANGFMGQGPVETILGVGEADQVDRLTIRWPSGREQVFTRVPVNCSLTITEGQSEYQVRDLAATARAGTGSARK
jgi:hypothetical protein